MEIAFRRSQLPFTLYDFFGYLLPGVIFGALVVLSFDIPKLLKLFGCFVSGGCTPPAYSFVFLHFIDLLQKSPVFISILCLLTAYVLGHIIGALSSLLFERVVVQIWLRYPTDNMFSLKKATPMSRIFPNFCRPYSNDFVGSFKSQFESNFKMPFGSSSDIFWLCFEFVAHNCPTAFARATHFLNLYGFSRNLSMVFFFSALVLLSFELLEGMRLHLSISIVYALTAFFLFWNYLKLLRRLNDEIYRAFYSFASTGAIYYDKQGSPERGI